MFLKLNCEILVVIVTASQMIKCRHVERNMSRSLQHIFGFYLKDWIMWQLQKQRGKDGTLSLFRKAWLKSGSDSLWETESKKKNRDFPAPRLWHRFGKNHSAQLNTWIQRYKNTVVNIQVWECGVYCLPDQTGRQRGGTWSCAVVNTPQCLPAILFSGFSQPKMAATFVIAYRCFFFFYCGTRYLNGKQTNLLMSHCAC